MCTARMSLIVFKCDSVCSFRRCTRAAAVGTRRPPFGAQPARKLEPRPSAIELVGVDGAGMRTDGVATRSSGDCHRPAHPFGRRVGGMGGGVELGETHERNVWRPALCLPQTISKRVHRVALLLPPLPPRTLHSTLTAQRADSPCGLKDGRMEAQPWVPKLPVDVSASPTTRHKVGDP